MATKKALNCGGVGDAVEERNAARQKEATFHADIIADRRRHVDKIVHLSNCLIG